MNRRRAIGSLVAGTAVAVTAAAPLASAAGKGLESVNERL